jgi:hypothetical protein
LGELKKELFSSINGNKEIMSLEALNENLSRVQNKNKIKEIKK